MRRSILIVAGLVVVAAVGVVLTRSHDSDAAPSDRAPLQAALEHSKVADLVIDPAPQDELPGAADMDSARAAAVSAVGSTDEVVGAGFISRRELIESFTTPGLAPRLAADTSHAVNRLMLELGERDIDPAALAVVEQPVTATAEQIGEGVRVRVWSVLVVAAPGVGVGRQVWRTVTLDMVQTGDRWLVDGWESTPGPTPAPPLEGVFDDATRLAEPLGWPAAVTAVGGA